MRVFLASLVALAFAVTGTANCALASAAHGAAAIEAGADAHPYAHLPPCHWPAGFDPQAGHAPDVAEDTACQGGAACVDCALAAGLAAGMAAMDGTVSLGAPRLFAVKAALPVIAAHDPPPPRA